MNELMAVHRADIISNRVIEIHINTTSPNVVPLDVIDLPGLVLHPELLKEQTESLAKRFVEAYRDHSLFLGVINASDELCNSVAYDFIRRNGILSKTIGVINRCDLQQEEWLKPKLESAINGDVQLHFKPHGIVCVSSPEVPNSLSFPFNYQARAEKVFFDSFLQTSVIPAENIGFNRIVEKLRRGYVQYLKDKGWIGRVLNLIQQAKVENRRQYVYLGIPKANEKEDLANPELIGGILKATSDICKNFVGTVLDEV